LRLAMEGMMNFGEKLKAIRETRGYSQFELVDRVKCIFPEVKISQTTLSVWESRDLPVDYEQMIALAIVLDTSLDDLVPDDLMQTQRILRDYAQKKLALDAQYNEKVKELNQWRDDEIARLRNGKVEP
jgi:transcriptional regulator with XRE-family HTH domain